MKPQIFTQPSMTEPGMSYTIPELIARHNAGHPPDVAKNPVFTDDDEPPIYRHRDLDFVDVDTHLRSLTEQQLAAVQSRERAKGEEQAAKERRDKINAEIDALEEEYYRSDGKLSKRKENRLDELFSALNEMDSV